MIRQIAGRFGYVGRDDLDAAKKKLRDVRQRLEKVTRLLERETMATKQLRAEIERLQKERRDETERHDARLAHLAAKHEEQLRERDARIEAVLREGQTMEQRVAAATNDVGRARDYLSAIEVKLDILEGAANVLDQRLRAVRVQDGAITTPRATADTASR